MVDHSFLSLTIFGLLTSFSYSKCRSGVLFKPHRGVWIFFNSTMTGYKCLAIVSISYTYLGLYLQIISNLLNKRLINCAMCPYWKISVKFMVLINLMSPSIHDIIFSSVITNFYPSSYRNYLFNSEVIIK